jgi:hypothetical protein
VTLEAGTPLLVAIAWHASGPADAERTLIDEDGDDVPDLDEVVVGVFTDERLARAGAEAYCKTHADMLEEDPEHEGHGRVVCVTLNSAELNQHGTGTWVGKYDAESSAWDAP